MTVQQTKTRVNGEVSSSISITDRGLQFGDGVFETIRVHQGRAIWWQQHIDRLLEGCRRLGFNKFPDIDMLESESREFLAGTDNGTLKITITRGNSSSGYMAAADCTANRIITYTAGQRHQNKGQQGIVLGVCQQQISGSQTLAGIKHLNRLEQVLARAECQQNDWDEGIMLDANNQVIEGSMSNLFIWQQGKIITPPLDKSGIEGICRQNVISVAEDNGFNVEFHELKLESLIKSEGIFVTNSLIGIWPVVTFISGETNDQHFQITANTRLLQQKLEAEICWED